MKIIKIICKIVYFLKKLYFYFRKKALKKIRHSYKQKKAIQVYEKLQEIKNFPQVISYLRKIDPFVFEELILYAFEQNGYKVYRNKRYTGDGGIDGKVKFYGKICYIQAKRYTGHINSEHVKNFALLCKRKRVNGFFIHTGKTGEESKKFVKEYKNIRIISGEKLMELFIE